MDEFELFELLRPRKEHLKALVLSLILSIIPLALKMALLLFFSDSFYVLDQISLIDLPLPLSIIVFTSVIALLDFSLIAMPVFAYVLLTKKSGWLEGLRMGAIAWALQVVSAIILLAAELNEGTALTLFALSTFLLQIVFLAFLKTTLVLGGLSELIKNRKKANAFVIPLVALVSATFGPLILMTISYLVVNINSDYTIIENVSSAVNSSLFNLLTISPGINSLIVGALSLAAAVNIRPGISRWLVFKEKWKQDLVVYSFLSLVLLFSHALTALALGSYDPQSAFASAAFRESYLIQMILFTLGSVLAFAVLSEFLKHKCT